MTRILTHTTALLAIILAAGCVTINIYFPASAAEKAADAIIDEVWQTGAAKPTAKPAAETPKEKAP
jgi:uncharacterized protein